MKCKRKFRKCIYKQIKQMREGEDPSIRRPALTLPDKTPPQEPQQTCPTVPKNPQLLRTCTTAQYIKCQKCRSRMDGCRKHRSERTTLASRVLTSEWRNFFLIVNLNIQADNSLKDEKIDRHIAAVLTKFRQPHTQIYKDMKLFYQSRELEREEVCGEFEHKNSLTNTAQKPASL